MDAILQDARYTWRQVRRAPGSALTVVLTLSLAIAANTAVLSLVNAWLLRPLPATHPEQLVSVWRSIPSNPREPAYFDFYRDYLIWQSSNRTLRSLAATFSWEYTVTGAGEPRQIHGAVATWNLFATVGAAPALGRTFASEDVRGEPVCVVGHAFWRTQFAASPDVIGRSISLNGTPCRIIGVLPASFSLRVLDRPFEIDVWRLITADDPYHSSASLTPVAVIGRLRPGVSARQAEEDLNAIQRDLNRRFTSDEPRDSGVLVSGWQQDTTRTVRASLLLLWAAVAVLLVIACVNAGSLILGRHARRASEFAVRLALGCGRGRLLQQLLIESIALFAGGGALGAALALVLIRVFVARNPIGILPPGGVTLDPFILAAMTAVVGGAAVLFGTLPAMRALRGLDGDLFRTRAVTPTRRQLRSRMSFVTAEIALSLTLLVTAALLISSYGRLLSQPPGFRTSGAYVGGIALPLSKYPTPDAQAQAIDDLLPRLRAIPSVRAAAASTSWPFQANGFNPIEIEGRPDSPGAAGVFTFAVGPDFFETLGVPLRQGRDFTRFDRAGTTDVAVINEELARLYFGGADPLGRRIRPRGLSQTPRGEPWLTVIGVVSTLRTMRYNRSDWDQAPAIYTSVLQRRDAQGGPRVDTVPVYLYVQTPHLDAAAMAASVHALDPDLALQTWRSTGDIVDGLRAQPKMRASLVGAFAALTLLLAVVGVYGVLMQFVEQQRREIGIRLALGAGPSRIVGLVLRRTMALVAAGLAAGGVGIAASTRLLRGLLYGVSPFDPVAFLAAIAALALVAFGASYVPARRAASTDPNAMLHCD